MALSTFPYLTATGDLRYRSVDGAGTLLDPDYATVKDPEGLAATNAIGSKLPTLGQKAQSGSVSVVPATGSSILVTPVTYSGLVTLATSAGSNVKSSAGNVYSLSATNLNTSTRYIQLFDRTTAPITGTVPLVVYPLFGSNLLILDTVYWGLGGLAFTNGISWGYSTTPLTYTAGTSTDVIFEIRYI